MSLDNIAWIIFGILFGVDVLNGSFRDRRIKRLEDEVFDKPEA